MIKKILIYLYFLAAFLILFTIGDFFISKYTNYFSVRKDCFDYIKLTNNQKNYYSYVLAKNCFAFEHKGATPSYKVYTDEKGLRVSSNKKKIKNHQKIIFLGDSFTYGFGVNYEDSVPGLISKKINNSTEVLNFGVPGYSPSMNLVNLKKYLKNKPRNISKVFYMLDLTDVHDEANRWEDVKDLNLPVIVDEDVKQEIKKTFDLKSKFRAARFLSYYINNNLRNLRKSIKNRFGERDEIIEKSNGTFWGSFTHTSQEKLLQSDEFVKLWKKDYLFGLNKIKKKIKNISELLEVYNVEFYIVIHPWRETLDLGQQEFNWENYAFEVCKISKCKKLINFFTTVEKFKKENVNWKTQLYFKNDLHFNKNGNALYANKIYNEAFKDK